MTISGRPAAIKLWTEIAVAYALIEAALWTPTGAIAAVWILAAGVAILLFVVRGPYSASELGLNAPTVGFTLRAIAAGTILAGTIALAAALSHTNTPPTHALRWRAASMYAVWALVQQFILQSFFFVRLESLLGGRVAVLASAALFAAAHVPNVILTVLSFFGGLLFCEGFRRYRSLYPLGVAHAMFGLTIAASFSDELLRHMRVGMGYLMFR